MINPKELRIGNYVRHGNDNIGSDRIIETLEESGCQLKEWKYVPYDKIQPIKLTEDRLVKMGYNWSKVNKGFWMSSSNRIISIYREPNAKCEFAFLYNGVQYVELPYVHQLQNLHYSLTYK